MGRKQVSFKSVICGWTSCKKPFKEIKKLMAINIAIIPVLKMENHCYMEKCLLGQNYTHLYLQHFMFIVACCLSTECRL